MERISKAENLLLEFIGTPFLAFVLNVDEQRVTERLTAETRLSDGQESTLAELVGLLGSLERARAQSEYLLSFELQVVSEYQPQLGTSWATAKHLEAGGRIDLPEPRDLFESTLLAFIRDTYANNLLVAPGPGPEHGRGIPILRHPQHREAEEAVLADQTLARLFPDEQEDGGRVGEVYKSTGSGGTVRSSMLASIVLRNGWERATQRHGANPSMHQWADAARDVVDDMRRAVDGEKVSITALVGVTGMQLPEGSDLTLPWGRLRPATDADRRLVPSGLSGFLTTTTPDGSQVEIDYAGDLVMEMRVPYKIAVTERLEPSGDWPLKLSSAEIVEERLETLRLAFLLGVDRDSPPVALGTWRAFLDPLGTGGMSWADPRRNVGLVPIALTEDEAASWREWTERIHRHRVENVEVAVRRTLRAAAERNDPVDGLVDTVIAWENLFGSREGEPTLRIAAAIAWLLGDDGGARRRIRKQVSDLYALRSRIVHGDQFLESRTAGERYRESLRITIEVLRRIFRERPELLKDYKDSTERSIALILDSSEQLRNGAR